MFVTYKLHHVGIVLPSLEEAESHMRTFDLSENYRQYVDQWHCWCIFTKPGDDGTVIQLVVADHGPLLKATKGAAASILMLSRLPTSALPLAGAQRRGCDCSSLSRSRVPAISGATLSTPLPQEVCRSNWWNLGERGHYQVRDSSGECRGEVAEFQKSDVPEILAFDEIAQSFDQNDVARYNQVNRQRG
jgi:hypothetical protein